VIGATLTRMAHWADISRVRQDQRYTQQWHPRTGRESIMADYYRQILVASDLSPRADRALSRAWQIAAQHAAALTVLHVVEPVGGADVPRTAWDRLAKTPEQAEQLLRQEAEVALRDQLDRMHNPRPSAVDVLTRVGDTLPKILDEMREQAADLVVLGAHGRHSMRDRLLGTLAENVVRSSACPVLVVRTKSAYRYRQVLVPVDFSDASRKALELARQLAPGAKLRIMHVDNAGVENLSQADGAARDQAQAEQEERMSGLGQRLRSFVEAAGLDPDTETLTVRHGSPDTLIVRTATDLPADLIVIGTRNVVGVSHLLLGSVATHTLREARCDVLAVHG
jgi:nucleotide-binding universal stress UspA family protein